MAHFAQIDENNIVTQVLVIEQNVIDTGLFQIPTSFIQTSFNTRGGVHYGEDGHPDDGAPFRKNYAAIGYVYDPVRDAFYAPQPFPSWTLNEDTCFWESPVVPPNDGKLYQWDENALNWIEMNVN